MPSRRRTRGSSSILEDRIIVAQVHDASGVWIQCSLSLNFDQTRSQGLVSLRLEAEFEGFDGSRSVMLLLPPESLQQLNTFSDQERIPASIKEHMRHHIRVRSYKQILMLSLTTNTPGQVVAPRNDPSLTPSNAYRTQVQNFQCLCRATQILLYVPIPDLSDEGKRALESFARLIPAGNLTSVPLDTRRIYSGRGGRVTTWEIFHIPELPPSYDEHVERASGKRTREANWTSDIPRKRTARDPNCPSYRTRGYVPNSDSDSDFSTQALSPLLPPRASKAAASNPAACPSFRELVCEILRAELQSVMPAMLREMLPDMLRHALEDPVHGILENLVEKNLSGLVEEYMADDGTVEEYIQAVEIRIQEQADNLCLELKETRDECLQEIDNAERDALERLRDIEWDDQRELTPLQKSRGATGTRKKTGKASSRPGKGLGSPDGSCIGNEFGRIRENNKRMWREKGTEDNRAYSPRMQKNEGSVPPRPRSGCESNASAADTESKSQGGQTGGSFFEAGLEKDPEASQRLETLWINKSSEAPEIGALEPEDKMQENSATDSPSRQDRASNLNSTHTEATDRYSVETGSVRELDDDLEIRDADQDEDEVKKWEYPYAQHGLLTLSQMNPELYTPTEPDTESDPNSVGLSGKEEER